MDCSLNRCISLFFLTSNIYWHLVFCFYFNILSVSVVRYPKTCFYGHDELKLTQVISNTTLKVTNWKWRSYVAYVFKWIYTKIDNLVFIYEHLVFVFILTFCQLVLDRYPETCFCLISDSIKIRVLSLLNYINLYNSNIRT